MTRSRRQDPSKTQLGTTLKTRCAMEVNGSGNCRSERVTDPVSECRWLRLQGFEEVCHGGYVDYTGLLWMMVIINMA